MIFLIRATLYSIFLFNKFYLSVDFYYKLILINKFIKHNHVNDMCCVIKYLDLYLLFIFCNFIFIYSQFSFLSKYLDFII